MRRILLYLLAALLFANGLYIFFAPMAFYENTPGVAMMGPFNLHFIRDAGLAYMAGGGLLAWGASKRSRPVAVAGAVWFCLHALFHIQIWVARGAPMDVVALVNLTAIQVPAWAALWLAMTLKAQAD